MDQKLKRSARARKLDCKQDEGNWKSKLVDENLKEDFEDEV
ncbi:16288_t:CDS:2 [Entrophospora sp. SA101]|nr:16288_t:CDS:2 [Entrophospora sp. SA101]CAJ0908210.1 21713_t:CDS:2 [Entrophospora sp. SA101]